MDRDGLVVSRIEDRIEQCRSGYYITSTGLLDSHEQALAGRVMKQSGDVRMFFYGGYEGAERRMLVCVPDGWTTGADYVSESVSGSWLTPEEEEIVDGLLMVLRVTKKSGSKDLTHRDYLGSVLGLGIDRSVTGDILVRPDGADIIIVPEIAEFLLAEYRQAGRTELEAEIVPVSSLIIPEANVRVIRDTVPSARLDTVISTAFKLSRSKAADAIRGGIVAVDHMECLKPDFRVSEGAVLTLRGKGRAVLREVGGESRKGRIWIVIDRFI